MANQSTDTTGEEEAPRVDIRSRIAAFSGAGQTSAQGSPPSTLRKPISTSALLEPAIQKQQGQRVTATNDEEEGPRPNVKSIIALYGQKRSVDDEKGAPPAAGPKSDTRPPLAAPQPSVLDRPTSIAGKAAPPAPPLRPAAPQLPPRLATGSPTDDTLRPSTGSSTISDQNDASGWPYAARKAGGTAQKRADGEWATRSSDDLLTQGRPANGRSNSSSANGRPPPQPPRPTGMGAKWASTSSGNLSTSTTAPAPPPRPSNADRPAAAAVPLPPRRSTGLATTAVSQSSSPRPTSRTQSSVQRSTARPTIDAPSSFASPSSEALAPPPRHIDTRRSTATRIVDRGAPMRVSTARGGRSQRRRQRRRDERTQMVFECEPSTPAARKRYAELFTAYAAPTQPDDRSVVRIWQRSKLDAWFLQRVWESAVERSGGEAAAGGRLSKEAFVRAMGAIDGELARRSGRTT